MDPNFTPSTPRQQPTERPHDELPPVVVSKPQPRPSGMSIRRKPPHKTWWFRLTAGLIVAVLVAVFVANAWYKQALLPVSDAPEVESVQLVIEPGSTPDVIASHLQEKGVIRSSTAFLTYVRMEGLLGRLQAGSYRFSPAESTQEIVKHLLNGQNDEISITFYPGSALYINAYDTDQTPSHREVLERLGYARDEIEAALESDYDHPLLQDKPKGASVEGYIYGETYQVASGASVREVLVRTFDEMYAALQQNDLIEAYREQGLTVHEAVTLASIIEREVGAAEDRRQVAQIFFKRLNEGMPLGADATFVYAARMDGQTPTVNYNSPYNTRVHGGLPPGPIASPGLTALKAVANPATGDYLYFVSGDDGKNYFSYTLSEHERNTATYCRINCALF